ncbi:MAG: serpin family protein [Lawsonibacter sp.]
MGLEDAFTPGQADFSRMGDHPNGYYLSEVLHASKLQVNEKGTEAAAATLVAPASGVPTPEQGVASCCWTAPLPVRHLWTGKRRPPVSRHL